MRSVVSVSLPPDLAAELHASAAGRGISFSEYMRQVLELGRAVEAVIGTEQRPAERRP